MFFSIDDSFRQLGMDPFILSVFVFECPFAWLEIHILSDCSPLLRYKNSEKKKDKKEKKKIIYFLDIYVYTRLKREETCNLSQYHPPFFVMKI